MRARATTSPLLIAVLLCLSAAAQPSAPQQTASSWRYRDDKRPSPAELQEILRQHKLWLESEGKSGAIADLSGADLSHADLRGAFLFRVDLSNADLSTAD